MASTKKKVVIKKEADDDEEEDPIETATNDPPTRAKMKADPIAYRHYVRFLATTVPEAPPHLDRDGLQKWNYRHLLAATLEHLLTVFKDEEKPREEAWRFYQNWLVVNNTDYAESPFWSFESSKGLFEHLANGKRELKNVAPPPTMKEKDASMTMKKKKKKKREGGDGEGEEEGKRGQEQERA